MNTNDTDVVAPTAPNTASMVGTTRARLSSTLITAKPRSMCRGHENWCAVLWKNKLVRLTRAG